MDLTNKNFKSRGLRNNNPFNLRKSANKWQGKIKGTDPSFETFDSVENGIRAGMIDIINDISLKNQNTLKSLFATFAPEHENDTAAYIKHVSAVTGRGADDVLNPNKQIDANFLYKLAAAIIAKENLASEYKAIDTATIQEGVRRAITAPQTKKFIKIDSVKVDTPKSSGKLLDASIIIFLVVLIFIIFYFKIKIF